MDSSLILYAVLPLLEKYGQSCSLSNENNLIEHTKYLIDRIDIDKNGSHEENMSKMGTGEVGSSAERVDTQRMEVV